MHALKTHTYTHAHLHHRHTHIHTHVHVYTRLPAHPHPSPPALCPVVFSHRLPSSCWAISTTTWHMTLNSDIQTIYKNCKSTAHVTRPHHKYTSLEITSCFLGLKLYLTPYSRAALSQLEMLQGRRPWLSRICGLKAGSNRFSFSPLWHGFYNRMLY